MPSAPSPLPVPLRAEADSPAALLAFAQALADAAGRIARGHFRTPLAVEHKADASPVTVADRAIEATLRAAIAERFPAHGILGEEEPPCALGSPTLWVVDPIDGTKSFVTGMPLFGTLLAVMREGRAQVGVIDMPVLGERWTAHEGAEGITRLNGMPCRVSGCERLEAARLYATSPDQFADADAGAFAAVSAAVRLRRFGGDCYAYGLLASGHVDLVMEAGLQPYDFLALVQVVEQAGGTICDWDGTPLGLGSDGRVLAAASPALRDAALTAIRSARPGAGAPDDPAPRPGTLRAETEHDPVGRNPL